MAKAPDPFSTASTEFHGLGDYEGRTVLVYPVKIENDIPSTRPGGGTYSRITADVVVLDGDLSDELDVTELPTVLPDMFISGSVIVPQLRSALKNHRPVLGVVQKQPARVKGNNPAVILNGEDVTEDQKKLARAAHDWYEAQKGDPFGTAQ